MEKNNETPNKIVETYAEDMAKIIENDQSGLIKKIVHEEEGYEIAERNLSPESRKNKFFMVAGLLFILIAFFTLFYFFQKSEIPTVPIERQFTPLIFNDKSIFLEVKDFKKDQIAQAVRSEVNATDVKNGGVEGIYLTENKNMLGLRRFIALIRSSFIPDSVDFLSDNFLLGVVNGETKDFFALFKVRSLPDVFETLRAWEDKMFFDLQGFLKVPVTSETKYLLTKEFEDGVIENKNARILYNKDGSIVMMYVFADDNSVVITETIPAAHEIMLRLAASRVKK